MGHNNSKAQRYVLLIANTVIQSTHDVLMMMSERLKTSPKCHCYSFVKFPQGETTVISPNNQEILKKIQLVIVIGENADLLYAFSIFSFRDSPHIYAVSNSEDQSTPSLYNFSVDLFEETSELVLEDIKWQYLPYDELMKLQVDVDEKSVGQATCQIEIHRGMTQSVLILNIYLENSCEEQIIKIGQFRGDGLLISTPMGSYGKSLSLNGPLMDRTMQNIMITPICPLSMKFRPLLLPSRTSIFIELDETCRTQKTDIYIDENSRHVSLEKGQMLKIKMSPFKTKIVAGIVESTEEYFIRSLKNVLGWGEFYHNVEGTPMRKLSTYRK